MCSASFDSTVKLWDVELGKLVYNLNGHGYGLFSFALFMYEINCSAEKVSSLLYERSLMRFLYMSLVVCSWLLSIFVLGPGWERVPAKGSLMLKLELSIRWLEK